MVANLRLLVADDHDVVRKGVRTLLEEQPDWEVLAKSSKDAKPGRRPNSDGSELARFTRMSGAAGGTGRTSGGTE